MWVKILGTACVAIFVGAAVVEYKQVRLRDVKSKRGGRKGDGPAGGASHDGH